MSKRTRLSTVSVFTLLVLSVSSVSSKTSAEVGSSGQDISGKWVFNASLSDDLGKQMRRMVRRDQRRYGDDVGSSSRAEQVYSESSERSRKRRANATRAAANRLIPSFLLETLWLKITQSARHISISNADHVQRNLYTDGREPVIGLNALQSGKDGDINVNGWDNDQLVVETTTEQGVRVIENYSVDNGANLLNVDYRLYHPKLDKPVKFRRVYKKTTDS